MMCPYNDGNEVEVEDRCIVRHVGRDRTDVDDSLGIATEEDEGKNT